MPAILWILGIGAGAWAIKETGDAVENAGDASAQAAGLARWVVIGGVVYVGYRAARKAGVI